MPGVTEAPTTRPAAVPTVKKPVSPAVAKIAASVRAAKDQIKPVTAEQIAAAKASLYRDGGRLNRLLTSLGDDGWAWRDYLMWDVMVAEVKKTSGYDVAALAKAHRRYSAGFMGLEVPEMVEAAAALGEFTRAARGAENAKLKEEGAAQLETIAATLEAIGDDAPTAEQSAAIGAALGWLYDHHQQVPEVTATVSRYSQPNLLVDVSERLLVSIAEQDIDDTAPVTDCILGTSINGVGRTIGRLDVDVIPDASQASFTAQMNAVSNARAVGTNRSALVYSRSRAVLHGDTQLMLGDSGLTSTPVNVQANVQSTITGFGSTRGGLLGRIVTRLAAKKAPKQKPKADVIAQQHTRQRFASRMREQIAGLLGNANTAFSDKMRAPLLRFNQTPQMVQFSSTDDSLRMRLRHDLPGRLAAGSAPPELTPALVGVRVHESIVVNASQGALAGRKFDEQRVELLIYDLTGKEDAIKADPDAEPFSITFADVDPITASFDDQILTVTVRGKGYTAGEKVYGGMNIGVSYKLTSTADGVKAERQGPFQIYPPGFVPGSGKSLPLGQVALKSVLQKKVEKIEAKITEELSKNDDPTIRLEGEIGKRLGALLVNQVKLEDGWLVVGLEQAAARSASLESTPTATIADAGSSE